MASIVQSTIEARVERVQAKLRENDVDAKAGDVILRNLHEYLLIKEYRERKLKSVKEKVQTSLTSFGFGPCPPPFVPPSGIPASTPSDEQPFPPHRKTPPTPS